MAGVISREDVLRARESIGGRLHRTPVFSSATLGERMGAPVHLKAELFQRTGSFKPRGVLTKLASLSAEEKRPGVIGISAGNHAQALAYCAALEGVDALIVMWEGASALKIEATRAYGAEVDLEAADPTEAFERLHELMTETGRPLVHPFDDPFTIAGQGTVGLEILEDVPEATVIVVPVGGGGLISGIAIAAEGRRVVAVEPELSDALSRGLEAGKSVPVKPSSIADGLSAPFAGEHAIRICQALGVESVLVTEDEIAEGMRFLYGRAKLACEPAAAVGVAALLAGKVATEAGDTVVAVVSGGNVVADIASAILGSNEARHPS
ncbi:MAG: threonine/serine dehydratase [Actinomycetota bacterium]